MLDHVVIQNCNTSGNPIVSVESAAQLILQNFTLKNINGETEGKGGSIVAGIGSYLEVDDASFRNVIGMAVFEFLQNATGSIRKSSFVENSSPHLGSAICAESSTRIEMEDVTFLENSARLGGGAVSAIDTNLQLKNCRFFGNHAMDGGGLLFMVVEAASETLELRSHVECCPDFAYGSFDFLFF